MHVNFKQKSSTPDSDAKMAAVSFSTLHEHYEGFIRDAPYPGSLTQVAFLITKIAYFLACSRVSQLLSKLHARGSGGPRGGGSDAGACERGGRRTGGSRTPPSPPPRTPAPPPPGRPPPRTRPAPPGTPRPRAAAEEKAPPPHDLHGGAAGAAGGHFRQDPLPGRGAAGAAGPEGRPQRGARRGEFRSSKLIVLRHLVY